MAMEFPHRYDVFVTWQGDRQGLVSSGNRPIISGGPPPEFGGTDDRWSPEHLLLTAVGLCFLTTFATVADKSRLPFSKLFLRTEGTLDKTADGLVFTDITLHVNLAVAEADLGRADAALASAKKHCIVSNALKPEVKLVARVSP